MASGQYEAGLARIQEGLRENPRDTELHLALTSGGPVR
jgi:general secretion pathway protein D